MAVNIPPRFYFGICLKLFLAFMFDIVFNKKLSTVSRILLPAGIPKPEKYNVTYS
jgi:hypothetical protein